MGELTSRLTLRSRSPSPSPSEPIISGANSNAADVQLPPIQLKRTDSVESIESQKSAKNYQGPRPTQLKVKSQQGRGSSNNRKRGYIEKMSEGKVPAKHVRSAEFEVKEKMMKAKMPKTARGKSPECTRGKRSALTSHAEESPKRLRCDTEDSIFAGAMDEL